MTRNIGAKFDELYDEVSSAVNATLASDKGSFSRGSIPFSHLSSRMGQSSCREINANYCLSRGKPILRRNSIV